MALIDEINPSIIPCHALLFAVCLFSAPIHLDISEFDPEPNPSDTVPIILNIGDDSPTAANASASNPTTHIQFTIL